MTQRAMIYGVPFFVATMVKNAKMVPVMIGAIVLGGKSYSARKYAQVGLIIAGVVVISFFKAKKATKAGAADDRDDEIMGIGCIPDLGLIWTHIGSRCDADARV